MNKLFPSLSSPFPYNSVNFLKSMETIQYWWEFRWKHHLYSSRIVLCIQYAFIMVWRWKGVETVSSWMEIGWRYHLYSRCTTIVLYLIHFLLLGWCRDGEGWKWALVTILTPTVKELFALHTCNSVVKRIV